ncbi:electron transport complex protein RnfD [Mariprofundus ferrinatatus]|uniref:Ion-translocating oxidoreductase complex subunit D n=1 Tax=Mariprofundus ferrinatatus TaxID=1921087 RepID=A0A2K8L627_9PROT|nr:RnfABCDGE type electron transport complex subunit D [Mariprofundus ferrinatatus]ATX82552.1 electron transport complex protein RnfD [Mariprofundus ferrinatatus]
MPVMLSPPHAHGGDSIRMTMLTVVLALLPATAMSVYLFGWLAVLLILTCMVTALVTEAICLKWMGRPLSTLLDNSAALTGLFLALTLPAAVPWWMALLASVFAIVLGKQIYGGLGYNIFNPALSARIILLISFPLHMTTWIVPMSAAGPVLDLYDFQLCLSFFLTGPDALKVGFDAISMASPLGYVKTEATLGVPVAEALKAYDYSYLDAFLGFEAGSIGETSALALLIGGIFLLTRHTITWHIPLSYIATVLLLAGIFNAISPDQFTPPLFHLFAGGLILCAFFMATDPVSSPVTPMGQVIFGIGCGILTWSIRSFGGYPEGAMFAVLLMNCAVPLIDHYFRPRVFGYGRGEKS